MTVRRFISLITFLLLLTACSTSRRAREGRNHPDDLPNASASSPSALNEGRSGLLKTGFYARANVNKVQRLSSRTWQGKMQRQLDTLCLSSIFETTQVGLCIYDLTDDCLLYAVGANQRLRPASTMKILTAVAGLDILGKDYTYTPTVLTPGWGWCWDDDETGISDFGQKGERISADTLYAEKQPRTMQEVLLPMMKKSINLLAESLFWQLPTKTKEKGITRKDCSAEVENVIRETGLNPSDYVIADGSGLSLYDYVSPMALTLVLRHAYMKKELIYDILYPTLPIAGVDGTLSKRMKGTSAQGNVHAKTGTVTGVSTLAGYCTTASKHLLCFTIMNQGIPKAAIGKQFQDKVCTILTSSF